MTTQQKIRAEKKADTALCKIQDLYYGYDIDNYIASKADAACEAVRDLIRAIERADTERKKK